MRFQPVHLDGCGMLFFNQAFGQNMPAFRNKNLPRQLRIHDLIARIAMDEKIGLLFFHRPMNWQERGTSNSCMKLLLPCQMKRGSRQGLDESATPFFSDGWWNANDATWNRMVANIEN